MFSDVLQQNVSNCKYLLLKILINIFQGKKWLYHFFFSFIIFWLLHYYKLNVLKKSEWLRAPVRNSFLLSAIVLPVLNLNEVPQNIQLSLKLIPV